VDGVWLFRVGDLRGENVQDPGSRPPHTGSVDIGAEMSASNLRESA